MSQLESGDWVTRLSATIRGHESSRIRRQETLARYEIQGELGRGGMGVIYRARDLQLDRIVALKVLRPEADESAEARERFLREAQLAAQLNHPNIVPVFDTGEHQGQIFLSMPLIEGTTLDKASLDPRQAAQALHDGARGVQHAHDRGIIHRDLKPGNLMIDRQGRLFVMDFGLARRRGNAPSLTLSGIAIGTPAYMPPEQARGQAVDVRSDVYSLGATLYEVLAGHPPFKGANAMEIMKAVTLDEPPPLRSQRAGVPKDLEAIVLKAMAKKPEARYASAAELADDLERFLKGEPVRAPSCGPFYRLRKRITRHRWRVLAATSLGALLLVGGASAAAIHHFIVTRNRERAERRLEDALIQTDLAAIDQTYRDLDTLSRDKARTFLSRVERARRIVPLLLEINESLRDQAWDRALEQFVQLKALPGAEDAFRSRASELWKSLKKLHSWRHALQLADLVDKPLADEIRSEIKQGHLRGLGEDFDSRFKLLPKGFEELQKPPFIDLPGAQIRLADYAAKEIRKLSQTPSWDPAEVLTWIKLARSLGPLELDLVLIEVRAFIKLAEWMNARKALNAMPPDIPPHPDFARLWVYEAKQLPDPEKAIELLYRARSLGRGLADAHRELILLQLRPGQPLNTALGTFRDAQKDVVVGFQAPPELISAVLMEAAKFRKEGWEAPTFEQRMASYRKAKEPLDQLLSGGPLTNKEPLLEWARMLSRLGKGEEALKMLKALSETAQARTLSARIRTVVALKAGDKASLKDLLPELADLPLLRSRALKLLDRQDDALAALKGLQSPLSRRDTAQLLSTFKKFPEAIQEATRVVEFTESLEEEDYISGLFEGGPLSPAKALKEIRRDAYIIRAGAYLNLDKFDDCIKDADRSLEIDPLAWKAQTFQGAAHHRLGRGDLALRLLTTALNLAEAENASPEDLKEIRGWKEAVVKSLRK